MGYLLCSSLPYHHHHHHLNLEDVLKNTNIKTKILIFPSIIFRYGILGLGLGTGNQQSLGNFTTPSSGWQDYSSAAPSNRPAVEFPNYGGRSTSPAGRNYSEDSKKIEIEVPELIVGAILGPGGRFLTDIMSRLVVSILYIHDYFFLI